MNIEWVIENKDIIVGKTPNFIQKYKCAFFDLDNTIITTIKGNVFPKNKDDWIFKYSTINEKFLSLIDNDYSIIIISNQYGLKNIKKIYEWKFKINSIVNELNIDLMIMASLDMNKFRKPLTGFLEGNDKIIKDFDKKNSFICGDAAGREDDFSNSDLCLSLNLNISFKTPETFFLNESSKPLTFKKPKFIKEIKINIPLKTFVIMMGFPGSGKSTLIENIIKNNKLKNYTIINQDKLKTKSKCLSTLNNSLKDNGIIFIDRTNIKYLDRKLWIDIGKENNYKIYVIKMKTSLNESKKNDEFRSSFYNKKKIDNIVYNILNKNYSEPKLEDGIDKIIETYQITNNYIFF